MRYASNAEPASSFEAVKELIANAALTGAHMHLCHINSTSLKDIYDILPLVDNAKEGVIFDPETISDVGTYEDPNHPAVGVQWLLVNGELVVDGGELILDAAPGRPIRRAVQ